MKTINVSTFKKNLSAVLQKAKNGETITVSDRNDPIAIVSAYKNSSLSILSSPTTKIVEPKLKVKKLSSALNILREDRNKR
jgi:prevent-host-death family protein